MRQRGFSAVELLVTLSLFSILALIGAPSIVRTFGQLRAAEEARRCALMLISARDEAVRLRTEVRVGLTSTGLDIDIHADDSVEQSLQFNPGSLWESSPTAEIIFNGLGLARGISDNVTLAITNRGARSSLTINQNGTVKL